MKSVTLQPVANKISVAVVDNIAIAENQGHLGLSQRFIRCAHKILSLHITDILMINLPGKILKDRLGGAIPEMNESRVLVSSFCHFSGFVVEFNKFVTAVV